MKDAGSIIPAVGAGREAIAAQRAYYSRTAARYDELQIDPADEHAIALAFMSSMIDQRRLESVLDVGSGTGARATLSQASQARRAHAAT